MSGGGGYPSGRRPAGLLRLLDEREEIVLYHMLVRERGPKIRVAHGPPDLVGGVALPEPLFTRR